MVINQIASSIVLKVLVGIILAAAMIISFFFLSKDLDLYLGSFENGNVLQLFVFSALFIVTGSGLYFLFAKKEVTPAIESNDLSIAGLLSVDLKAVGFKFVEGFVIGLVKTPENLEKVRKI